MTRPLKRPPVSNAASHTGAGTKNAKGDAIKPFDPAAAYLVIGGGWVVGLDAAPPAAPKSLTGRVNLVATSRRELDDEYP